LVWRSVLAAQGPVSVYQSSSQTKQWRLYSGLLICGGLGLEQKEVEGIRIALAFLVRSNAYHLRRSIGIISLLTLRFYWIDFVLNFEL